MTAGDTIMRMVRPILTMHEAYARELTADLDEPAMDAVPGIGHENTPRFTIGHLCTGSALTRWVLEHPDADEIGRLDMPEVYAELFLRRGPADRRLPEASPAAPSRDELLAEFARQHELLDRTVRATSDEVLDRPCEWKLGHLLSRHTDLVMFACSHEALHLGQLASWRRAMGLGAAMARMVGGGGASPTTS
jgi:DinB superfamily